MRKLTIKKLTASDLTFFEWHFRNRNAGNQKAINLNKDIFIDKLYPSLPVIAEKSSGKIPLDLTLYGPGVQGEYNLQRKIVKFGAYKNWRLNGEFIYNPEGQPERFNVLEPGDMAILDFQGDIQPVSAKVVLLSNNIPEDKHLVGICNDILKDNKMVDIQLSELRAIVKDISPSAEHPINEILLDEILEDVSFGDFQATEKLLRRHPGKKISRSELQSARQNADSIGQAGEEFVNIYLADLQSKKIITEYEWISIENAISPFDFRIRANDGAMILVDVKSTIYDFGKDLHISLAELITIKQAKNYDIYRIYELSENTAKMRIAKGLAEFAEVIIRILEELPSGVVADSISINPSILNFGPEIRIISSG